MRDTSQKVVQVMKDIDEEIDSLIDKFPFFVFLCGPAIDSGTPSAKLRERIRDDLKEARFSVVLGEDDGLKGLKKKFKFDAQTNELHFIRNGNCRVIIIIADSVGSQCELGLFNWLFSSPSGDWIDKNKIKFYVIADKQYKKDKSYFIQGPIEALKREGGKVKFCDFNTFNISQLIAELESIRNNDIWRRPKGR